MSWKHLLDGCVIRKMREDLSACCHSLLNTIRLDSIVMSSTGDSRLMSDQSVPPSYGTAAGKHVV